MRVLNGIGELQGAEGEELGVSEWVDVTQLAIDAFAELSGDRQWIHVDAERAKAGPFGGTIAHGFYTLSLGPQLSKTVYRFEGFGFGLNYGLNRVRFTAPLPVGSRLRLRVALAKVERLARAAQMTLTWTFEREGGDKPVCVAEMLLRVTE